MTDKKVNIAVLGATGVVGETVLSILCEREFPASNVYALASENSAGSSVAYGTKTIDVIDVAKFDFSKAQIAIFSAGADISKIYAPIAGSKGCIVIDNTSEFRYDDEVPLVIPEVNPDSIIDYKNKNIIANPNCSTIQMLVALKPLYDAVGIKSINVSTYQSVSGGGKAAISELIKQTTELLNGRPAEANVMPKQIAYNVIPHIDVFQDNGYSKEEMKMVWETQKIFADKDIIVNPTAVRVPVLYGHSEAITIETKDSLSADKARELLGSADGITVVDDLNELEYPTPMTDAIGNDDVYVGRIRNGLSSDKVLNLWVVSDNVRKGAALNSVQIAELLVNSYI